MGTTHPPRNKNHSNALGAGAAGGGMGTVVASIAAGLPSGSPYKELLTVCSPVITVAISGLWLFLKTVYIDPFVARKTYQANHSYIATLLVDAKRYEAQVLADPRSTIRHKEEVRKKVERLEIALMQAIEDRATTVEILA
jgi:hypothetical protein